MTIEADIQRHLEKYSGGRSERKKFIEDASMIGMHSAIYLRLAFKLLCEADKEIDKLEKELNANAN